MDWLDLFQNWFSFHADPSGTFMKYQAKAIGSGSEGAQTELQKEYHKVKNKKLKISYSTILIFPFVSQWL